MWYEFPLGNMRRVLLLVLLLLVPAAWAEEPAAWLVEVEDPFGNPIEGCEIVLKEPWTGSIIDNPGKGMYQPSATCEGYVVMWSPPIPSTQTTVVLQAHPIIDDLFSVQGAHTMQVQGSTWQVPVSDGEVDAPSGIPIILIGDGGTAIRNSESTISIPANLTTYSFTGNYSENISVKAIHLSSGMVVEWHEENLTVGEYGGGWIARVYNKAVPVGISTWPPTDQWVSEQVNSTKISGLSKIEFTSGLEPNQNITGLWSAEHVFNNGLGLPFIPGVSAGIESQINRYLDGSVANLNALIETIYYHNGKHALCCLIDDKEVKFFNFNINSNIEINSGYWGWTEQATISAERSSINLMRFEVPFQNDIRQTTPLTISTNGEWQYLSSPLGDWIVGTPDNFTLIRDDTSISGYYTITLGKNSPPVVSLSEANALPWNNVSYDFQPEIIDAPLSVHTCDWNISGISQNLGINLSAFDKDSLLPISVVCEDEGGLTGSYSTSLVLDGSPPSINSSNDIHEISPGFFEWYLDVSDDHDDSLEVYWTSNKSEGWWYEGQFLQTSFNPDYNLNSINDNITERHKQRNPIEYWLAANVSDDVGQVTYGNWTVKLLDKSGPVIIGTLESRGDDGEWKEQTSITRPGDELRLNLTASFDDHNSIDKISFQIEKSWSSNSVTETPISSFSHWSQVQYITLPELEVGSHQLSVVGTDESGNHGGSTFSIAVAPPIERNLEIIDISLATNDIEPGENQFMITVQNNGASTTEFILCSGNDCVDSIVGPSTYMQTSTTIVMMKVDMDWFETFSVELSYLDDSNKTVVKHSTTEFNTGAGIGGLELSIAVVLGVIGIMLIRSRNQPRF